VVTGDFFVVPPTEPCALRSTQPLKLSTRDFSWGKGVRCVWLTTYHPCSAATSRKSGVLTYLGLSRETFTFSYYKIKHIYKVLSQLVHPPADGTYQYWFLRYTLGKRASITCTGRPKGLSSLWQRLATFSPSLWPILTHTHN